MRYYEIISDQIAETGVIRPRSPIKPRRPKSGGKPPLTPEQSRREAERKAGVQRQMRDENLRHSAKVGHLRDKITRTP